MSYETEKQVLQQAEKLLKRSLRNIICSQEIDSIEEAVLSHGTNRKGFFGDLIEEYGFGIANNNRAESDFVETGIELKSTPVVKNKSGKLRAKERLVFSMINYMEIIDETWETSSFLKKNQKLLILFYLYEQGLSLLDYKIRNYKYLDLLSDLSEADVLQIIDDWNHIVSRIRSGQAHLLSEGETAYLGAATKAKNKLDTRQQPYSDTPAKKRAFSLKQSYLNALIQQWEGKDESESLFTANTLPKTISQIFDDKLSNLVGKTEEELADLFELDISLKKPKNIRRILVNRALGVKSNKITELIKANITLKVIKLEESGKLKESISFPIFKYMNIINQEWEDSDFYKELTERSFIFVVFKKSATTFKLDSFKFWSFPTQDLEEAERVWNLTVERIKNGQAHSLPKISESSVAHVRPHARDSSDTLPTPLNGEHVKKCFWLNAKYIEQKIIN